MGNSVEHLAGVSHVLRLGTCRDDFGYNELAMVEAMGDNLVKDLVEVGEIPTWLQE